MRAGFAAALGMVVVGLFVAGAAEALTVGLPPDFNRNSIPFGESDGSRYQQVYSAAAFPGIVRIQEIRFFSSGPFIGTLNTGTYRLSLSTSRNRVNFLNTVNFDSNLGVDNQLFTITVLGGGPVPAVLSFAGTPFLYNPAKGDLLLDIQTSNLMNSGVPGMFDARNGTAGGVFSRVHNFSIGLGTSNYGLVTEFVFVPEPTTGVLVGMGLLVFRLARRP